MTPLKLTDAESVIATFEAGARANRDAPCRRGSIDYISAPGRLIATGDLHDNPIHFGTLVRLAGMEEDRKRQGDEETEPADSASSLRHSVPPSLSHITFHEIIHSDRLINGMDLSYRALAKVAALKTRFPEHVHCLLGNHELAQIRGLGIIKDGVRSVDAFNKGVEYVFGAEYDAVTAAINDFVRSLPLALRVHTARGDILCAHSLPPAAMMGRFDTTVLSRDLTEDDYTPHTGAAHLMTWGRGYDAEGLEDLTERWGIYLFLLGHEKAETGAKFVPPNALILASDHEHGRYLPLDLDTPPRPEHVMALTRPLAGA